MPSVNENKHFWDGDYAWANLGDEWSAAWGGPSMQWYGAILPRVHRFLPTERVLEIACGYGRWTEFLKDRCEHLVAIDLSAECVAACKERFAAFPSVECHVNDGRSLDMVGEGSIDFVFSFDSLVHVDESVIDAYLAQLPRILSTRGAAFLHHSNLGEYRATYQRNRRIPGLPAVLERLGLMEPELHGRDFGVSAELVAELAERHGLRCIGQEIVPWGTRRAAIDCFSTIVRQGSPLARANRVLRNPGFMQEVESLARLARLYAAEGS